MIFSQINIDDKIISDICRKYSIEKLSVFGSYLHGNPSQTSDIDILVEFIPGKTPGFAFITLQDELEQAFNRKVDLHTPESLSKYFRNLVVKEAQAIYDSIEK